MKWMQACLSKMNAWLAEQDRKILAAAIRHEKMAMKQKSAAIKRLQRDQQSDER